MLVRVSLSVYLHCKCFEIKRLDFYGTLQLHFHLIHEIVLQIHSNCWIQMKLSSAAETRIFKNVQFCENRTTHSSTQKMRCVNVILIKQILFLKNLSESLQNTPGNLFMHQAKSCTKILFHYFICNKEE